jgi:hypothetical protein
VPASESLQGRIRAVRAGISVMLTNDLDGLVYG